MATSKKGAPAAAKHSQGSSPTQSQSTPKSSPVVYTDSSGLYKDGQSPYEELTPYPKVVNIEQVADDMVQKIQACCVLSDEETHAIVLWIIASYTINSFRIFAALILCSPEKRCGKSTTLEILKSFCRDAKMLSHASNATIYRMTKKHQLTLLMDEADTYMVPSNTELTGLINSGHQQSGAQVSRCVGDKHEPIVFSTWMPKVIASIGVLPPTIMDRGVIISLRRKLATESVVQVPLNVCDVNKTYREKICRFALDNKKAIEANPISPINLGNDRARDNWTPMHTVASQMGASWMQKCDTAYRTLVVPAEKEASTQLLQDIRERIRECKFKKISTKELVEILNSDKDLLWHQYINGRAATAVTIAGLLKPYGIRPKVMRISPSTQPVRGYEASSFDDAFNRYLDP